MAIRVKLKIKVKSSAELSEAIALINSGFETSTPQLLVPKRLAEKLGFWPSLPAEAKLATYGTAGGAVRVHVIPKAVLVSVGEEDVESPKVESDLVISEIEDEVLTSDKLAGKLGLVIEDIGEGLWLLKADKDRKIRRSYPPQYW